MWFVPDLFIGLIHRTGAHGQHDGPSLGCGDGDDHHPGQYHDVDLKRKYRNERRQRQRDEQRKMGWRLWERYRDVYQTTADLKIHFMQHQ